MTLTKAIEILEIFRDEGKVDLPPDVDPAITLGIEALKRVELHRTDRRYPFNTLLPGETPDDTPTRSQHHIKELQKLKAGEK